MGKLEIKYVNINDIVPYNKNPRKNEEAIPYVMQSIKEFGFKNPVILDKNNVIVCGHTRVESAKRLNIEEIPCLYADDLSEEQIKAYRLADNKVSEKSKWNKDLLMSELFDLDMNMEQFGFDDIVEEPEEVEEELEFGEILGEEHNYVVLYFDNEVDWLQAESLLGLKEVKCGSTRKDGVITSKMNRTGIGRVINGRDAINRIRGE